MDRFRYPDDRVRRRVTTGFAVATMWGANIGGMGSIGGSPANALPWSSARRAASTTC